MIKKWVLFLVIILFSVKTIYGYTCGWDGSTEFSYDAGCDCNSGTCRHYCTRLPTGGGTSSYIVDCCTDSNCPTAKKCEITPSSNTCECKISCLDYSTCTSSCSATTCPTPPTEICDEKDNNCNNIIDDGCELIPGKYEENDPKLVYIGDWGNYQNNGRSLKFTLSSNAYLSYKINGNSMKIWYFDGTRTVQGTTYKFGSMRVCIDSKCNIITGDNQMNTGNGVQFLDFVDYNNLGSGIHSVKISIPNSITGTPTGNVIGTTMTPSSSGDTGTQTTITEINIESIEVFGSDDIVSSNICGDNKLDAGEDCEDGNIRDGDGCSSACKIEEGWCCTNNPSVCTIKKSCTDYSTCQVYESCNSCPSLPIEICDDKDNDCDGETNEGLNIFSYRDIDGDGFGDETTKTEQCQIPKEYVTNGLDCNDEDKSISPNAKEICGDNMDNNCNLLKDENCKCLPGDIFDCSKKGGVCTGYKVTCGTNGLVPSCDYSGITNYQTEEKTCDSIDNDCDGLVDEGCDDDKDGFIDSQLKGNDCDDSNLNIHPNAEELCNNLDDDCDGIVDNFKKDTYCSELSSFSLPITGVCKDMVASCDSGKKTFICDFKNYEPGTETSCDNLDNNCNGRVDENCPCNNGEEKACGNEAGTCNLGVQKCVNKRWGECSSTQPSEEICDNKDNNCNGKTDENLVKACNDDCGSEQKCENGEWLPCRCSNENNIEIRITNNDIGMFVINADLNKEDVKNVISSLKEVNQTLSSSYKEGITEITTSFSSDKQLKDVDYALFIPKCLSPYLDKLNFENKDYDIIKEDPLIAWHFASVKDRIDLSYSINGRISQECLQQIKALPIAKIIGPKLEEKAPVDMKKIILPVFIMAIIAAVVIFIQRPKNEQKSENKEEDLEKNAVEKQRQALLKTVKGMKFKTKEQSESYIRSLGMSEDTIEWIMKKL
jgi:cysteine-rich repeat protein